MHRSVYHFSRNGLKYWSIVYFSATKLQGYASDVARRTFSLLGHVTLPGTGLCIYYYQGRI